jgi:hypothetical protein
LLSYVSGVVAIVSANYWRNPVVGLRRDIDLVVAKVSFGIYFVHGLYKPDVWDVMTLGGIVGCYCLSWKCHELSSNTPYWILFHSLFHGLVAYEQYRISRDH